MQRAGVQVRPRGYRTRALLLRNHSEGLGAAAGGGGGRGKCWEPLWERQGGDLQERPSRAPRAHGLGRPCQAVFMEPGNLGHQTPAATGCGLPPRRGFPLGQALPASKGTCWPDAGANRQASTSRSWGCENLILQGDVGNRGPTSGRRAPGYPATPNHSL